MGSVGLFIGGLIMMLVEFYLWSIFYDSKLNYRSFLLYFSLFFLTLISFIIYSYVSVFVRISIVTFFLLIFNRLLFKRRFNEILISTLYGQFLLAISDSIGISILALFYRNGIDFVKNNFFGTLIGNIVVSLIFLFIVHLGFIKKIYLKLVGVTNQIKNNSLIIISFISIVSINILMALSFYKLNSFCVIIINLVLLIIYSIVIYKSLSEKNNSIIVKAENDSLMSSLHLYEDMVDRQRVDNHENKNQLLIIRNMIKKKDKDVIKYIETIVKDQKEDDEALYTRVMTIPSGGLQGIIYQKMLVMKDENITFSLDVGRRVRDFDLSKLSIDDNYRLCKIIGVLLDNAIEESRNIKDKCIMISLFIDSGDLIIDVSNRFEGKIDIDKLDESGYTTKGDGHGYGLSLVKKILSETKAFENERCINRNVFKQIIRIKNT